MIIGSKVRLIFKDVHSGQMPTELPLDVAIVLLQQATTLEEFRILWLGMCQRTTAYQLHKKGSSARAQAASA